MSVATLGNMNGPSPESIGRDLGALAHSDTVVLSSERPQIEVPAKQLAKLAGTYEVAPTAPRLTITVADGRLLVQQSGPRPPETLLAESDSRFYAPGRGAMITVEQTADGTVTGLVIHRDNGQETRARRVATQ